ncbi:hypothetical protein [Treponema putidum]|uniref:hypothetical protein n=1 Tax=Treponema putidum TaxID=221027 RepID=UPI003D8F1FE2
MTFDLSGIPEELQVFIKEALEIRKAALLFAEKEIKVAMQESINEIKKHIGYGTFKGINKELNDVIEEQKIFFAAELDRILDKGLTKASYAGLSIGNGILKHYKAKGLIKGRLIEKDIIREAELIAKSTMEKKRVFKNKEFVLSDRIWDLSGNNYEKIKEIISSGINTDCVKVAKALTQYVKEGSATLAKDYPNMYNRMGGRVPKNLNYEALRLARNELSEVYWQSTIEGYKDNPAIKAVKWLLSNNRIPGFHDVCDELAYADDFGLGAGIYPLDDAPEKPHICCLCNLAPIIADDIKKGDAVNKPPENWEEIKERLRHKSSFINMDELTEEQKETLREQRREAYKRQKEKKERLKNDGKTDTGNKEKIQPNGLRNGSVERDATTSSGRTPLHGRGTDTRNNQQSRGDRGAKDVNTLQLQAVSYGNGDPRDYIKATAKDFRDNFSKSIVANPYKAFVEIHDEDYYKSCKNFMQKDGLSGISVTKDGNIVSVFKAKEMRKGELDRLIPLAIDNGGKKLDNFDGNLSNLYSKYGFIPVSKTPFNDKFAPSDWNYERDGRPDIIFWVHNGKKAGDVMADKAKGIVPSPSTLNKAINEIPIFKTYDAAEKYRDGLIP